MKTSDLTLSIIVIITFLFLYVFNIIVVSIQQIKDNWPVYRCQPLVMPFAAFFGFNSRENFAYCIKTMQKGFMDTLMQPLTFNISMLSGITSGLTTGINMNRQFLAGFRINISDTFNNIFASVFNIMIEIQRTVINVKDVIGKLIGVMTTTLYVLSGSIMTMNSAWSGPPGDLVRALCFHPETKLKLKNGNVVAIKDVPLNSILENGAKVCAVMQISNLDENNKIVEKMYRVKRMEKEKGKEEDILVSGSHLIYYKNQFIHVKDLPTAEESAIDCEVLSCLITSDHTIPIGEWIFHDWEDNNGSESKTVGA